MSYLKEIRISGSGGQGIILAGIILAEAAMLDGKNVVQTQSYGPEARGGASKAEIIIADDFIDYPKVFLADIQLALTQEACDQYAGLIKRNGILIVDEDKVSNLPSTAAQVYQFPIVRLAKEKVGKEQTANMVALGVLVSITGVVSREALEQAVEARVPSSWKEVNQEAISLGWELGTASQSIAQGLWHGGDLSDFCNPNLS
ncbi:2-oxoacid:acceptor oxidoreductase family protein [Calderihabitans maritimus]|uniref:2-oxoglutarate synthase n=1 Tax=Calderihabitans maritimus TaxID=1246530 RepID=A0A1Z5HQX3_9FIRM|nr:2-oxoacid:acceptor oxidoreductase family protein [Calderihabitans maritimus]GAW91933.1 2-oxoglutarate synthase [Calderihabitans maritimus]